jgi:hypothetical protein
MAFLRHPLRMELDRSHCGAATTSPSKRWWRTSPLHLPAPPRDASVLLEAISRRRSLADLAEGRLWPWPTAYDEAGQRYRGLRAGQTTTLFDLRRTQPGGQSRRRPCQIEAESQPAPMSTPPPDRPTPPRRRCGPGCPWQPAPPAVPPRPSPSSQALPRDGHAGFLPGRPGCRAHRRRGHRPPWSP